MKTLAWFPALIFSFSIVNVPTKPYLPLSKYLNLQLIFFKNDASVKFSLTVNGNTYAYGGWCEWQLFLLLW